MVSRLPCRNLGQVAQTIPSLTIFSGHIFSFSFKELRKQGARPKSIAQYPTSLSKARAAGTRTTHFSTPPPPSVRRNKDHASAQSFASNKTFPHCDGPRVRKRFLHLPPLHVAGHLLMLWYNRIPGGTAHFTDATVSLS